MADERLFLFWATCGVTLAQRSSSTQPGCRRFFCAQCHAMRAIERCGHVNGGLPFGGTGSPGHRASTTRPLRFSIRDVAEISQLGRDALGLLEQKASLSVLIRAYPGCASP